MAPSGPVGPSPAHARVESEFASGPPVVLHESEVIPDAIAANGISEPLRIAEWIPRLEVGKAVKCVCPTNVGVERSVELNPIQLIPGLQSVRPNIVGHGVEILERVLGSALRNPAPGAETVPPVIDRHKRSNVL